MAQMFLQAKYVTGVGGTGVMFPNERRQGGALREKGVILTAASFFVVLRAVGTLKVPVFPFIFLFLS